MRKDGQEEKCFDQKFSSHFSAKEVKYMFNKYNILYYFYAILNKIEFFIQYNVCCC